MCVRESIGARPCACTCVIRSLHVIAMSDSEYSQFGKYAGVYVRLSACLCACIAHICMYAYIYARIRDRERARAKEGERESE